jgi:polar amino acid transport system permease protein
MRTSRIKYLRVPGIIYVKIFQSVPVIFWMIFFYYVFPDLLPYDLGKTLNTYKYYSILAAIIALTLDNASYVSDILKNGKEALPPIQREVAISTGLNRVQQYIYVLLPQMFRLMLPPLGTRMIHNFKNTSLCMVIATPELMWATQQIESLSYRGIEAILIAAVFYISLSIIMASTVIILERHLKIDALSIISTKV